MSLTVAALPLSRRMENKRLTQNHYGEKQFFPCISWWWNSRQPWGNKTNELSRQQISTERIGLTLNVPSHHLSLVHNIHYVTCWRIVPSSPVQSAVCDVFYLFEMWIYCTYSGQMDVYLTVTLLRCQLVRIIYLIWQRNYITLCVVLSLVSSDSFCFDVSVNENDLLMVILSIMAFCHIWACILQYKQLI